MSLNDPKILIGVVIGLVIAFGVILAIRVLRTPPKAPPSPIQFELSDIALIHRDGAVAYASMSVQVKNLSNAQVDIHSFELRIGRRRLHLLQLEGKNLPLVLDPLDTQLFKLRTSTLRPPSAQNDFRHFNLQVCCNGSGTKAYQSREYRVKAYRAIMR